MAERKKRAGELDDLLKVSCRKGMPVMRPLVLAFPEDKRTWDIDDEFMYGDNLLVAPVLDDVEERKVYLPKGRWIREDKADSPQTYTAEAGGIEIAVEAPLGVIPLFRRIDDYSANE
jgi:alpha-D-xyloside xylohydrolase